MSQPEISKNSIKTPILGVQGSLRSSMLLPAESSLAVLVKISSKSVCLQRAAVLTLDELFNSGEITIS